MTSPLFGFHGVSSPEESIYLQPSPKHAHNSTVTSMVKPTTLDRDVSPPPLRKKSVVVNGIKKAAVGAEEDISRAPHGKSEAAAVEAHEVGIRDHLSFFANHLATVIRPTSGPRLSIGEFQDLYQSNQHSKGAHFVIHQHDHPIAGVHYDLRLQFSESSSVSWAIPYGVPGNPNSLRPNRMAIETRVHNLWNNLIESASHATGSLLIWDTGEYEVMPRSRPTPQKTTDDEISDVEMPVADTGESQSEKLFKAFQSRHIRLRLHGSRLPQGYTIALRLPSANDRSAQPNKPGRKRRRLDPAKVARHGRQLDSDDEPDAELRPNIEPESQPDNEDIAAANASEDDEDSAIRSNNAYTGAQNTIGSVHQRHWFLTIDRQYSGFRKARDGPDAGRWVGEWDAFYVQGRDHERSLVTGRLADDVMEDEGVKKFVGRKMWRPIME